MSLKRRCHTKTNEKKFYMAAANVAACLGVIILHTNFVFWTKPGGRLWITSCFLETFFYWPVPVFFMLSGANLLDYRERYSTVEFLKKRISRTLIPFLFWSLAAELYLSALYERAIDWSFPRVLNDILNAKTFSIYWFFLPLFGAYLSMPVLSRVEHKIRTYLYAILCGMFFVCILPLVCRLLDVQMNHELIPPIAGGYLIYVMLGYVLDRVDLDRKTRCAFYLLGIIGWLMQFIGTILASEGEIGVDVTFKGYTNFPAFLQAAAVFVFLKYADYEKLFGSRMEAVREHVMSLSSLTYGIYLIHYFFVVGLPRLWDIQTTKLSWRLGGAVGIFFLSAGITWLLKKIPIVRRLVP